MSCEILGLYAPKLLLKSDQAEEDVEDGSEEATFVMPAPATLQQEARSVVGGARV